MPSNSFNDLVQDIQYQTFRDFSFSENYGSAQIAGPVRTYRVSDGEGRGYRLNEEQYAMYEAAVMAGMPSRDAIRRILRGEPLGEPAAASEPAPTGPTGHLEAVFKSGTGSGPFIVANANSGLYTGVLDSNGQIICTVNSKAVRINKVISTELKNVVKKFAEKINRQVIEIEFESDTCNRIGPPGRVFWKTERGEARHNGGCGDPDCGLCGLDGTMTADTPDGAPIYDWLGQTVY